MLPRLETFSGWLARMTDRIVVAMGITMILCLVLQVFSRYILGATFSWTEELALLLFTWLLLLAMTSAIYRDGHVRLFFLVDQLPEKTKKFWLSFLSFIVFVFFLALGWSGYRYMGATLGQTSAAIRYPIEILHLAAPVCGVLGSVHALNRLVNPLVNGEKAFA